MFNDGCTDFLFDKAVPNPKYTFRVTNIQSADGITSAVSEPPDLVLMDLQLPGIDGMEALRQLRESSRTADIPVVAVTAQAMKQDRERALDAGFNGYVEKPISVRAFPDQVRRFLSGGEVGTE